jgi:hypothetical protein
VDAEKEVKKGIEAMAQAKQKKVAMPLVLPIQRASYPDQRLILGVVPKGGGMVADSDRRWRTHRQDRVVSDADGVPIGTDITDGVDGPR